MGFYYYYFLFFLVCFFVVGFGVCLFWFLCRVRYICLFVFYVIFFHVYL